VTRLLSRPILLIAAALAAVVVLAAIAIKFNSARRGSPDPAGMTDRRSPADSKVAITLRRDEPTPPPAVPGTTSNNTSDSTLQGSSRRSVMATFEELSPLEEWLKGREILGDKTKSNSHVLLTRCESAQINLATIVLCSESRTNS